MALRIRVPSLGSQSSFVPAWALGSNTVLGAGAHTMKKNVASQAVGVQMVSATTGAAFTSAVTVSVTGDAGTQATGSVGSGACTHEGNGFHTYAPAQAETNYDHIAFTFTGTGAVPVTVQVYPTYPQTGDNFPRIGAPVGASISADIAGVQSDTDNIQTRIPAALVSGRIDASVGAMAAGTLTATAIAADAITAAKIADGAIDAATFAAGAIDASAIAADAIGSSELAASAVTEIQSGLSTHSAADVWAVATRLLTAGTNIALAKGTGITGFNDLDAAGVRGAVGLASASLDTQLGAIDDYVDTEVAAIKTVVDAIQAKTDNLPSDPADASDIATATTAIAGYIDTEVAAIKAKTDQLTFTVANKVDANATHISGSSTAADNLEAGATGLVPSTCAVGSTTTSLVTNLTEDTDDHYNGRVVTFISGALDGQSTSISDYNGTTKTLTVVALTEAPANTDAFVIS